MQEDVKMARILVTNTNNAKLDDVVKAKIITWMNLGHHIMVFNHDQNLQRFLASYRYKNVTVYCNSNESSFYHNLDIRAIELGWGIRDIRLDGNKNACLIKNKSILSDCDAIMLLRDSVAALKSCFDKLVAKGKKILIRTNGAWVLYD